MNRHNNSVLELVESYDDLISKLPKIDSKITNTLLKLFAKSLMREVGTTTGAKTYILFNQLEQNMYTITSKQQLYISKIIKPTWCLVFMTPPEKSTIKFFVTRGWIFNQTQNKHCLTRLGYVKLSLHNLTEPTIS
jgi:hypothetical protein